MTIDSKYWARNRFSRRHALRAGGLAGAGLAGAALIGCGDDDDDDPMATPAPGVATPAATPEPDPDADKFGGTLHRIQAGIGDNFNQPANWQDANGANGTHVYDRPLTNRADERVWVLEAAESIEAIDETTLVMKLKPGMVYQDKPPVNGRPVEAQDVVDLWMYVRDEPRSHNPFFPLRVVDTAEATDDVTVSVTLQAPFAYTFSSAGLGYSGNNGLVPRELLDNFDLAEPVGSGPYQLVDYSLGSRYEYERNPTYRGAPQPYIDRRTVTDITDQTAQEAAFRGEQLHTFRAFTAETAQRIIGDLSDRIEVAEFPTFSAFTWGPSSERPDFDDVRVREGLWRIFEPDEYIDIVRDGHAVPVPGMLAAGLTLYQLDWEDVLEDGRTVAEHKKHDIAEGVALLEAAGFDFNKTYVLSTIVGAANETAIQVFEQQMRRAGITNFRHDHRPGADWIAEITPTGNYDFTTIGHPAEDTPHRPMRLNHSTTGLVHQGFNVADPEIDAVIEASEQAMDFDEHVELIKEAQRKLIMAKAHMAYIHTAISFDLTWSYLRDWEFNTGTHVMYQTQAWLDV
jgi:ABC-type transport system substrate-binding protein